MIDEQINKKTRYHYGVLETYHDHQKQWFMATDKEAKKLGLPKLKMGGK